MPTHISAARNNFFGALGLSVHRTGQSGHLEKEVNLFVKKGGGKHIVRNWPMLKLQLEEFADHQDFSDTDKQAIETLLGSLDNGSRKVIGLRPVIKEMRSITGLKRSKLAVK